MKAKKWLLAVLAAAQFLAVNAGVSYRVYVNGAELPGRFSAQQTQRAALAAAAAAAEIGREGSEIAAFDTRAVLFARRERGDTRVLADALIMGSSLAGRYCAVYAEGELLGCAADPAQAVNYIEDSLHNAFSPALSGLRFRPVYSYAGRASDYAAITAAAVELIEAQA